MGIHRKGIGKRSGGSYVYLLDRDRDRNVVAINIIDQNGIAIEEDMLSAERMVVQAFVNLRQPDVQIVLDDMGEYPACPHRDS